MMFNDTVTVYNRCSGNGADQYLRTVVKGVHAESSRGAMLKKTGISADNGVTVIVPKGADAQGKTFADSLTWQNAEDKTTLWTLQDGDKIVFGTADYDIAKTAAELFKQYNDVYTVTAVDFNGFGALAHWEVTAK